VPEPLPWKEILLDVEVHPSRSFQLEDGRMMPDAIYVVTEAAKERLRLGYMCCNCLEQFEVAFPIRCRVCGFPVAKEQGWLLQKQMYDDHNIVSPGIPLEREREHMERSLHVVRPSMKVPKGSPVRRPP